MINQLTVLYMSISAFLCFCIPTIGYIVLRKGTKGFAGVFIGGMLSFYLTQMIVRIPIVQLVLPQLKWYQELSKSVVGIALFLGLSAALFETFGRSLTLNLLLKKKISYRTGLIHGLGHGGIEAILFVGINYVIYVVFSLLLNSGVSEPLIVIIPPSQQDILKTILTDTNTSLFLVAGIERSLTIVFHIAMSLLITIGIAQKKQVLYTSIVILLHTLLDMSTIILSYQTKNIYIIESVVVAAALISIVVIIKSKNLLQEFPNQDDGEKAVDEGF